MSPPLLSLSSLLSPAFPSLTLRFPSLPFAGYRRATSNEPICMEFCEKSGRCQSCHRKVDIKCEHRCTKCNFVYEKHANKTIAYSCIDCPFTTSADAE